MEPEYYRTFIALPVSTADGLLAMTAALRDTLSRERISWVRPANFHFTLRFLGDTPADQVERISEALTSGIHARPFMLRMTPPDVFGPRKRPRVLFTGTEPSKSMEAIHLQVESVLNACGWPPADQPFRAHLTLGRIRSLKNIRAFYDSLERFRETQPGTLWMDRLVFFRSVLEPGGPVYTPITEVCFD